MYALSPGPQSGSGETCRVQNTVQIACIEYIYSGWDPRDLYDMPLASLHTVAQVLSKNFGYWRRHLTIADDSTEMGGVTGLKLGGAIEDMCEIDLMNDFFGPDLIESRIGGI